MKSKREITLLIRTDSDQAFLGLLANGALLAKTSFRSKGELSKIIVPKIEGLLRKTELTYNELDGVITYRGPGSFTGLRIGLSVANTIAFAQNIPLYGVAKTDAIEWWQGAKKSSVPMLPLYGALPHITKAKTE